MTDIPNDNVVILAPVKPDDIQKRGRGRPRTRVNPTDIRTDTEPTVRPPTNPPSNNPPTQTEVERLRRKKQTEITQLQREIVEDLNEVIITGLTTVGIPAEFLYKTGAPKSAVIDSNYTDLANGFCINSSQANWMAHGYVELKEIPAFQKFLGSSESKPGPSYAWIIMGAFGALSYIRQLTMAVNSLKEIQKQLMDIKEAAAESTRPEPEPQFSQAD